MLNKKLELINFSQGIRASEIQHNFEVLQYQLDKERVSVGGSGISYGLDFVLTDFTLNISEGCLINTEGKEVYINATDVIIEKPILISKEENRKVIDQYNRIYLSEIPYALNRTMSSNKVPTKESGITVNISNVSGSTSILNIASVDGKAVNIGGSNVQALTVDVNYSYTAKRRDIIFINNEYKIDYRKGITSTSPSVPVLKSDEFTYILGYIEVDGMSPESSNNYKAKVSIIKEFRSIRNVYTDSKNNLYLCGTPFDSIKVIHVVEPKNPEVDTFWYDYAVNKLKVWRRTDTYEFADMYKYTSSDPNNPQRFNTNIKYMYGKNQIAIYLNNKKLGIKDWEEGSDLTEIQKQESSIYSEEFRIIKKLTSGDSISYSITRYDGFEEWVAISDASYVMCEERFIWTPEMLQNEKMDKEHDLQTFFFNAEHQKNMLYVPGKNSLKIMIDQIPLHVDQYDEITMYDAITGPNAELIKHKLLSYYEFADNFHPDKINEEYENIGIGFRLHAPLEKNAYVEANISQRVNANPMTKRFQRTATFIDEGSFIYQEYINIAGTITKQTPIFETKVPFRYQENQLDVYLNGLLLERGVQYKEVASVSDLKGKSISKFELLSESNLKDNNRVSYKVTTNVYSYDHVDGLLSGFERRLSDIEREVSSTLNMVESKSVYIDNKVDEIEAQLQKLNDIESNIDSKFIKTSDRIGKDNLAPAMYKGIAEKNIDVTYTAATIPHVIDVTGVCSDSDFVILYNITSNRMLQRGSDYNISITNQSVSLTITSMSAENCTLYLSGIKYNRA